MSDFNADSVDPDAAGNGGVPGQPGNHDKSGNQGKSGNDEQPRIVIRDKRRIDPESGMVRPSPMESPVAEPDQPPAESDDSGMPADDAPSSANGDQLADIDRLTGELAERTTDLQRVNAEYANYRKRAERDREALASVAQGALLIEFLPVLDDIARADHHGDLAGGFKNAADSLRNVLTRAGLEAFGEEGDPFDPSMHEAVEHSTSPEVEAESVSAVMRKGYKQGDRILRAAMVAVVAPE